MLMCCRILRRYRAGLNGLHYFGPLGPLPRYPLLFQQQPLWLAALRGLWPSFEGGVTDFWWYLQTLLSWEQEGYACFLLYGDWSRKKKSLNAAQSLCILRWNKKGQAITYVRKDNFRRMDLVYLIVEKRSYFLFFYSQINLFCKVEVGLSPFVFCGFIIPVLEKRSS